MKCGKVFPVVALLCIAPAAFGQNEAEENRSEAIEEIVIVGHPLSADGLATPADVLTGEELERKLGDTLGATVAGEPGIHNGSYGIAVGRPVIHGLGGPRVRIMEDGIDAMDVSVTSGDHAVTVDPFIAERLELLKGSGTLLYGSGSIGGVVDTHTGRIPQSVPDELSGRLDLRWADNGNSGSGAFRLDGGAGNFAWHLDGFRREVDDYEIPGYAESALFRAMEQQEEHDHEPHEDEMGHHEDDDHDDEEEHHEEEEEAFGVLPGSALDMMGGAAGFSFTGERGFIGISVSNLNGEYGIPGHAHDHGHEHEEDEHHDEAAHHDDEDHEEEEHDDEHEEEGNPFIDLKQTRVDLEAGLTDPLPGFSNLNLRLGVNDYEHLEIEPSGEVGTAFENQAWEVRVELTHLPVGGWGGAVGLQLSDRSLSVVGEEAFAPPVDSRAMGVFWVGERSFDSFAIEAGARLENVEHEPANSTGTDFTTLSASLGAIVPLNDAWTATVLTDYSARAPVGEELFSNGPHLATRSFEIGEPGLEEEQALNFSATLRGAGPRWSIAGTLYYTQFNDFIYHAATGEEIEGLIVRAFGQADATFSGLDLEASLVLAEWGDARLEARGFFDTVSADLDVSGNDNLPLIPPDRAGIGLDYSAGAFSASVDYSRVSDQNSVADFELPTDGYDDLRAYVRYGIERGDTWTELYLRGRNLTGDEQRHHTSIVKDLAPAPNRTIEAGLRVRF
ncbi:MAG: TonB-dependent receptor [Gammaproteobacteria bacterium]|nr:TonB-dependent receptor [Gammaproteobacteria bacterium]MYF66611.1 TonB-dependent receptor [Gammaproteobacteria bacterium]MYK37077.1 TonB-dependent receptor [Gammaproteobacteria bacterium]